MKKAIPILGCTFLMAFVFAAVSCTISTEQHEHTFDMENWEKDAEFHWHTATCGHNGEKSDKTAHTWGESDVTKEATCTESGTAEKRCTVCGYAVETEIPASGHLFDTTTWVKDADNHWHTAICSHTGEISDKAAHTWGGSEITKEVTCTENGEITYNCSVCDATKTEEIPALGHSWNKWEITENATEDKDGTITFTCDVCKATKTEAIPALGHKHEIETAWSSDAQSHWHAASCGLENHRVDKDLHAWGESEVTKDATCTESGTAEKRCAVCGYAVESEIPATGHSFDMGNWEKDAEFHWHGASCGHNEETSDKDTHTWEESDVTKDATCTENGEITYNCSVCDATKTEEIPALGHSWNKGEVTLNVTEYKDGTITFTCDVCKATKTEAIPALGHKHEIETAWSSDAQSHWHTASCGREEHNVDKDLHAWGESEVIKEATCTESGTAEKRCTVCGYAVETEIPATGHSFDTENWEKDAEFHWHRATCGHNGETSDKSAHTWGEVEVTKEATCTENGEITYNCSVCGTTKTEGIPALGHSWNKGEVTLNATESKDGTITFTCDMCKTTKTEAIPALGHKHEIETAWANDAESHWHAASCGLENHRVDKDLHAWGESEVIKEATCTESGTAEKRCTVCGYAVETEIPATGHSFDMGNWEKDAEYHWHKATCGIADHYTDKNLHTTDTRITKEPTSTETGAKETYCTVCNYVVKTEEIPATGSETGGGESTGGNTGGDNTENGESTGGNTGGDNNGNGESTGGNTSGDNTENGESTGGNTSGDNTENGESTGDNTGGDDTGNGESTGGNTSGDNTENGESTGGNTGGGDTGNGESTGGNTQPTGKISVSISLSSTMLDITELGEPTVSGKTATFTAPSGHASYKWFVDDKLKTGATANTLEINTATLSFGVHSVLVIVDGKYSAEYILKVIKE